MSEGSPNPTSEIRIPKSPWLIVGLGNPGEQYADTYHNVGFRVLDRMADAQGKRVNIGCGPALISPKILVAGQQAVLVTPQTYMNHSGAALLIRCHHRSAPPTVIVVPASEQSTWREVTSPLSLRMGFPPATFGCEK